MLSHEVKFGRYACLTLNDHAVFTAVGNRGDRCCYGGNLYHLDELFTALGSLIDHYAVSYLTAIDRYVVDRRFTLPASDEGYVRSHGVYREFKR